MTERTEEFKTLQQELTTEVSELTSRIEALTRAQQEFQTLTWQLLERKITHLSRIEVKEGATANH